MSSKKSVRKTSKLQVVDIPIELLIPDEDNPNEMDEETFDLLIEEIEEQGFDEPIQVREHPTQKGAYQIGSGHHRVKAAAIVGMTSVPSVVKKWSDREQKVALVKRNSLRGKLSSTKLVRLYSDLVKDKDPSVVQRELGFTDTKQFEVLVGQVAKNMTPKQKKQLDKAKESIKSVDDLSSVLNTIFKESGSDLDEGYVVFSFGGKQHHYFQINDATNKKLLALKKDCDRGDIKYTDALQSIIANYDPKSIRAKTSTKKRSIKKRKARG